MKRSELNDAVKRKISSLENKLGTKCRKIWSFDTGRPNEIYLFGRFGKIKEDPTIATIAIYDNAIAKWIPQY